MIPTEDDYSNTLHCVDWVNSIHALRRNPSSVTMPTLPLLLCQFRKMLLYVQECVITYSYWLLVAYKHKIDTMAIKKTRNSHSNQYRWWWTVGVRHTLHKNVQSWRDILIRKHFNYKQLYYLRQYIFIYIIYILI